MSAPAPIDFYFDFGSPYGYIASTQIDALAGKHGRTVRWRPYLMGIVMKQTGAKPLVDRPMIDKYALHDMPRSARMLGLAFTMPTVFPVSPVAASRAYYALESDDAAQAVAVARAIYHAYWGEGTDIGSPDTVADIAAAAGADREALLAAMGSDTVKDRLRKETGDAIERGVFGSPFMFVDDEPFWGADRLWQIDQWLARGGW